MPNKGGLIGNDNLYVPDAPTVGTATAGAASVSVAFTAPSDVGNDAITAYGVSATDGTNIVNATGSSSPISVSGLTNGTSYTAQVWAINDYGNGPLSSASNSFSPSLSRAIITGIGTNRIDMVTITTTGNAGDFGNLGSASSYGSALGNDTRAVIHIGHLNSAAVNILESITLASTGNSVDFGDLTVTRNYSSSIANNVRGAFFGGNSLTNTIDYITIATAGNARDFEDMLEAKRSVGTVTDGNRVVVGGGYTGSYTNYLEYFNIHSQGSGKEFGALSDSGNCGGLSSTTRGVFGCGDDRSNVMDYITIATTGNATDFGDTTVARDHPGGTSNSTRGIFAGGNSNVIEYITIATTGNATDFGDLSAAGAASMGVHCSSDPNTQNETYFTPAAMGVFAGGSWNFDNSDLGVSTISYIDIATDGRLAMFGDLINKVDSLNQGFASTTRGGITGGYARSEEGSDNTASVDVIQYITFSTKGLATDFGNLLGGASAGQITTTCSNSVRGITTGGASGSTSNVIQYITIATAGNATDFGDTVSAGNDATSTAGTTRALSNIGGKYGGSTNGTVAEFVTIASTGNSTDFGDLTVGRNLAAAVSSNTRAVVAGGQRSPHTTIDYFTIATAGNATDFGDLSRTHIRMGGGVSSKVIGVFHPGYGEDVFVDNVEKITIASTGNSTDWGDWYHTSRASGKGGAFSNSHGGLA